MEPAAASAPSFLLDMFHHECITAQELEIDRLRMENRSLRESLESSRAASRASTDALRRMLSDMQLVMDRAAPKPSSQLLLRHSDQAVYQLASRITPEKPLVEGSAGKELIGLVVDMMSRHLTDMVAHVHYRYGIVANDQKAHVLRVVLASVLMWAFGIHLPNWEKFAAPKPGLTLGQEIPAFLRGAMYLRSYHSTQNKFPVSLLHTFIVNWNSFAKEQIGVHPLSLDPALGLRSMPLQVIVFPSNLECKCSLFTHRVDKRTEVSIRLYLIKKSQLADNQPSLSVSAPPPMLRRSPAVPAPLSEPASAAAEPHARALTVPSLSLPPAAFAAPHAGAPAVAPPDDAPTPQ